MTQIKHTPLPTIDTIPAEGIIEELKRLPIPAAILGEQALFACDENLASLNYRADSEMYDFTSEFVFDPIACESTKSIDEAAENFGLFPFHNDANDAMSLSEIGVMHIHSGSITAYFGVAPRSLKNRAARGIVNLGPKVSVHMIGEGETRENLPESLGFADIGENEAIIFDLNLIHAVATTSLGEAGIRLSTTTRYER